MQGNVFREKYNSITPKKIDSETKRKTKSRISNFASLDNPNAPRLSQNPSYQNTPQNTSSRFSQNLT